MHTAKFESVCQKKRMHCELLKSSTRSILKKMIIRSFSQRSASWSNWTIQTFLSFTSSFRTRNGIFSWLSKFWFQIKIAILFRLCNGGELFERIAQEQFFSEQDAANIIKQVLSAINYCHSRNIVHRDLKPENLLLDRSGDQTRVTIIDFGTAGSYEPG